MTKMRTLKSVFEECKSEGIFINLDDTYCQTKRSETREGVMGRIYAISSQTIDRIMRDIDEEGSADVSWYFHGRNTASIGNLIYRIFKSNGYFVEWDEQKPSIIVTVIDESNLCPAFLERWREDHSSEEKYVEISELESDESESNEGSITCSFGCTCVNCEAEREEEISTSPRAK